MASVNKVILVGNLGRDPEVRTFPSGDQVANVAIATTDRWRDKNTGENKEATEWHRVTFHGRLAEIAGQYLRKGSQVYIEGSLRTRKWTDQATGQERYATEIRADSMQMLGARQGGQGGQGDDAGYGGYDQPQQQQQQQAPRGQQGNYTPRQQSNPPGQRSAAPRQGGGNAYQAARNGQAPQQHQQQPPQPRAQSGFDDMDDDIPFADPLRLSGRLHYAI